MKLLYVEDNRAIARAVAKTLQGAGHQVTLVHGYADALAAPGHHDLGIFDLSLPDGDGIALCEELRRLGRISGALFCSGSIDDLLLERAQQTAPVVAKNASMEELCRAVAAAAPTPKPD